jgi:hypothetical protein
LWFYPEFRYAFTMNFNEISLQEIDVDNEEFRISEELDSSAILDSIRDIGQLNPVLLLDRAPAKVVICGFRRIRAIRRLGLSGAVARLLPSESWDPARLFDLALRDNSSHRQLNALEKARVLFRLRNHFRVSEEKLLQGYLPLLGLAPHKSVLNSYMALHGARPSLRQCLADGLLTHSSLEILASRSDGVQDRFASLMHQVRLSASLQKKVLELLDELSAMAGTSLDAPLEHPGISAALNDSRLSLYQKGEKLHAVLYGLRYPRLTQAMDRFLAGKRRLELPGAIRISPHPFFETADLRVEFEAPDAGRFRELALALQKAAQMPELEELFQPE